jgi:uncharacterized protein RhaS with RHS repeats
VTGLVRFGFRDYEPATGRWTSRDPALFSGGQLNLYAYAGSDPVGHVDRNGLISISVFGGAGLGVGAKISITSEGFSSCVEAGAGAGGSAEIDPFGGLDADSESLELSASVSLGPLVSGELGVTVERCPSGSGRSAQGKVNKKVCAGPFCTDGESVSAGGEHSAFNTNVSDLFKRGKAGISAKATVKICRQLKW